MFKYLFFFLPVAGLICWPDLLADGLPIHPPAGLAERAPRITIVQTIKNEPVPPKHLCVAPIVGPVESPDDDLPTKNNSENHKQSAIPVQLAAQEWRERRRQEQSTPIEKRSISVRK